MSAAVALSSAAARTTRPSTVRCRNSCTPPRITTAATNTSTLIQPTDSVAVIGTLAVSSPASAIDRTSEP